MNAGSITIIAKPTSECNFRCKYCYHADTNYEKGILDLSEIEKLVKLSQEEYDHVAYVWHGGEPLLCGIDYFDEIIRFQKKYRRCESLINNSVQTNGSLLSTQFVKFFKKNDFAVSISFDGPGECNNLRQSTDKVIESMDYAKRSGLKLSSLSVIHALNVNRQIEIYEFFKSRAMPMKFNPIFVSGNAKQGCEYLLETELYIHSLKALYDYWLLDQSAVPVDPLNQYITMILVGRSNECIYGSCLYQWISINNRGDIYPCGRSYSTDYRLGSISKINHISDIFSHKNYIELLRKSIVRRSICQNSCKYFGICNGGCNNNALIENGKIDLPGGFLCVVLDEMMQYISKSIESILSDKGSLEKYNPVIKRALNKKRLEEVFLSN
jgi:uncharacterized protein